MSFMSSGSLSSSRRLQRDSDEVMDSLHEFMEARKRALDKNAKALDDYEEEMENIGEIYESEEGEDDTEEPVDHNMMRHINASGSRAADSDDSSDDGKLRSGIDRQSTEESIISSTFSSNVYRPQKLTRKQRLELRENMISFFGEARSQELELERAMDQQLESSEDFPIKTFLELNQLHHSNYSGMMQRLNEYGPKPLGKVWLEDEDFKRLSNSLRQMQFSEDLESSAARQELSSHKHRERVATKMKVNVSSR